MLFSGGKGGIDFWGKGEGIKIWGRKSLLVGSVSRWVGVGMSNFRLVGQGEPPPLPPVRKTLCAGAVLVNHLYESWLNVSYSD